MNHIANTRINELAPHLASNGSPSEADYGSTVAVAEILTASEERIRIPEINERYLQSIALAKGSGGESDANNYHARSFVEQNGELMSRCRKLKVDVDTELSGIARQLRDLSHILKQTPRYLEQTEKSTPWTTFSKVEVVILLAISVALLAVGINTIAQVLLASGIRGFENPWRCYLFSLVPIGIAFGLKYLRRYVPERYRKVAYPALVWVLGLLFGVCWAVLFASTFPSITQSVDQIINSLSLSDASANDGAGSGVLFIVITILAEALLAAGCWLTIEGIVEKHQSPVRIDNPTFTKVQTDLDGWMRRKYELQELCGKLEGKLHALDEAKHRFVEEAVGFFHASVYRASQR